MTGDRPGLILAAALASAAWLGALAAVATTPGMMGRGHREQHMSGLKISGLAGYTVRDANGRDVGRVVNVQTDDRGRTRFVRAVLNSGEDVRIAAFRAQLDEDGHEIVLTVPVAAVVNDPGALIAPAPGAGVLAVASAGR